MRNVFKQIGVVAFVAIIGFSMASCGGGDGGGGGSSTMTWTAVADSTFGTGSIKAIAYGNNMFVAVGSDDIGSDGKMATSTNGITWTAVTDSTFTYNSTLGTEENIFAIAYGNGTFVAGGTSGKMAYSTGN